MSVWHRMDVDRFRQCVCVCVLYDFVIAATVQGQSGSVGGEVSG